ncbi:MAG: hypothetical protein CBB60_001750 [Armatimonadetes bacterium Cent15-Ar3]|nr:MAG: hypothetical protein CBB60_001750 [Armatimonadetes bacterium Cent15-Ar3]
MFMSAWICGVCGTPSSGDACPKCMSVRSAKIEGLNAPTSYAGFVAGPGSLSKNSKILQTWRLMLAVLGGLIILSVIVAQLR